MNSTQALARLRKQAGIGPPNPVQTTAPTPDAQTPGLPGFAGTPPASLQPPEQGPDSAMIQEQAMAQAQAETERQQAEARLESEKQKLEMENQMLRSEQEQARTQLENERRLNQMEAEKAHLQQQLESEKLRTEQAQAMAQAREQESKIHEEQSKLEAMAEKARAGLEQQALDTERSSLQARSQLEQERNQIEQGQMQARSQLEQELGKREQELGQREQGLSMEQELSRLQSQTHPSAQKLARFMGRVKSAAPQYSYQDFQNSPYGKAEGKGNSRLWMESLARKYKGGPAPTFTGDHAEQMGDLYANVSGTGRYQGQGTLAQPNESGNWLAKRVGGDQALMSLGDDLDTWLSKGKGNWWDKRYWNTARAAGRSTDNPLLKYPAMALGAGADLVGGTVGGMIRPMVRHLPQSWYEARDGNWGQAVKHAVPGVANAALLGLGPGHKVLAGGLLAGSFLDPETDADRNVNRRALALSERAQALARKKTESRLESDFGPNWENNPWLQNRYGMLQGPVSTRDPDDWLGHLVDGLVSQFGTQYVQSRTQNPYQPQGPAWTPRNDFSSEVLNQSQSLPQGF